MAKQKHKNTNHALKANDQQLEMFFTQSLHGFFMCMLDEPIEWNDHTDKEAALDYVLRHQRMTRVNQAMLDQYGAEEKDFIGISVGELFKHDPEHAKEIWRGLFDRGTWHVETREQKMDGTPIIIEGDYICIYDEQGRITGHFGVQVDITNKKKQEEQLQFQSTIVENISDSVIATDLDFKISYANNAALKLFGYGLDEIIGQTPAIFNAEPLAETIQQAIYEAVSSGKVYSGEALNKRKDGSTFHCEYKVMPMFDEHNTITGYVGIQRDITKDKQAQDELHKTRDQYQSLVENIPGVTYRCKFDKNWTMLYMSDDIEVFTGYPASDFINNAVRSYASVIHKTERAYVLHSIQSAVAKRESWDIEYRISNRKGSILWVHEKGRAVFNQQGEVDYLDGLILDISEKKAAEKAIISAREEAQAANKAKSEFLANMSHEIRTPLNGVIGFTDLLRNTPLNALQKQYLENANTSAHMLLGVISDILDFSKIESGKLELDQEKTDIIAIAGQVMDILKYKAAEKGLELLLNIQPDVPRYAVTDAIRLKQVLINLCSNAVKFTEEGEVELKLMFSQINENLGKFHFSVRDTGIGIDRSKHRKLFEAFYQADSSPTRRYSGTGLGLQISKLIVDKMQGNLQLESKKGKGSTFSFDIETSFERGEKPETEHLKEIKQVLVVDDNESNRFILKQTLLNWGIQCTCSKSGLAALQLIENSPQRFDVIIVDYDMPVLDGLETIRMIRQNLNIPAGQQPIVLLYSSLDNTYVDDACKSLDVDIRLIKPVKSEELFYHLQHLHQAPQANHIKANSQTEAESISYAGNAPAILLVEDVAMNMELTRAVILEMIPEAFILQASNGQEALDIIKREHAIDIIFMDIQMPVMDGLEATRRIRKEEEKLDRHIPIIALTAGVVKGEQEKCLKAGMDDFLAKPLNPDLLGKILQKHAILTKDDRKPLQGHDRFPDKRNRNNQEHFDPEELLSRIQGDYTRFKVLLFDALKAIDKYLDDYHSAISQSRMESVRRYLHSIKGIALHAGFKQMVHLAQSTEHPKQNTEEAPYAHYQAMRKELQLLQDLVKQYIDSNPGLFS